MIEIRDLTAAVAGLIYRETGVFAIDEPLKTAVYPSVIVEAQEKGITLIAGGRQVLRCIELG